MQARPDLSPKDPQDTVLHRIVREHIETFLSTREEADTPMPRFVVDELRGYRRCGVLAHGAACFRCEHCGRGRMVGLSCGGRGFCPRCLGRRMTRLAHEWTRWVLPKVRIRQWVLSLPLSLRIPLAFHHELVLAIHGVAARAIEGWYRKKGKALGIADGRTGMLTVIQRFGSDLALNVHAHSLVLDGVYDERGTFTAIAAPSITEMEALTTTIATRIARMGERRALDDAHDDERALLRAIARSVQRLGTTKHAPDGEGPDDSPDWAGKLKARVGGYDLECTTVVRGDDRERIEHLCKYLLRPPLADRRLKLLDDASVALELKTAWRDGTTWLTMDADTFLERLCSLVPKRREHSILYRGVLAAHSARRATVVPKDDERPRPRNQTWCAVMKHGLGLDVLACPCGQRMKFVAVIFEKKSLARMLAAHGLRARVMPTLPARAPPQTDFDFGA